MERKIIFKIKDREITLPVTPSSYAISEGQKVETVNLHSVGSVNIIGFNSSETITIECLFPSKDYSFLTANANTNPFYYIDIFTKSMKNRDIVTMIIAGTPISKEVLISNISYSEKDGSNDIYASLKLVPHTRIKVEQAHTSKTPTVRDNSNLTSNNKMQTYKVKKNDTLSAICQKFYKKASLYPKLGKYNKIKNYNLIYPGDVLKIPPVGSL